MDVEALDLPDTEADLSPELPEDQWRPVDAAAGTPIPDVVWFIDGVRRIDARIWVSDDDGTTVPGVCAVVAAGRVKTQPGDATVEAALVKRHVFSSSLAASDVITTHDTYRLVPVDASDSQTLYTAIHEKMTALELELSDGLAGGLVVFDGPLRGRRHRNGVGLVKTHSVDYLQGRHHDVIDRLQPGQRTPLLSIAGRFPRWSWYLRLPGPKAHAWSGVVRCEAAGGIPFDEAREAADLSCLALPRFASEAHKDSRAPQNLYPIAGMENQLRRRLGNQLLMERALRIASRSGPATAVGSSATGWRSTVDPLVLSWADSTENLPNSTPKVGPEIEGWIVELAWESEGVIAAAGHNDERDSALARSGWTVLTIPF